MHLVVLLEKKMTYIALKNGKISVASDSKRQTWNRIVLTLYVVRKRISLYCQWKLNNYERMDYHNTDNSSRLGLNSHI